MIAVGTALAGGPYRDRLVGVYPRLTCLPQIATLSPVTGHLIGYARTSRRHQNLDRQINALTAVGCKRIYQDQLSGKDADRPGLTEALDHLLEGDTLVVTELSRLGRSLQDLITIVTDLRRRGRCASPQG